MSIITNLFGSKKPTSAQIAERIAQHEADRRREEDRAAKAQAALSDLAELDDAEHVQAEADAAAAARAIVRTDARLVELRKAHAEAVKADERAALKARAEAARKRVGEAQRHLAEYEERAARLAESAAKLDAINREAAAVNAAITAARKAAPDGEHPALVESIAERFLTEPDDVTPERRVTEEVWEEPSYNTGRYTPSVVFSASGRPQNVAARKVTRERVIPEKRRPGRRLTLPTMSLVLPAARLGQEPFWPAG
ncbi:hypothetical protein [Methylobacterium isbiliense]|nr:hypothetical protein [Methylobacterium isbiliense]MDN3624859.1 hypothetical protein [Methylobacterium isbiliense]